MKIVIPTVLVMNLKKTNSIQLPGDISEDEEVETFVNKKENRKPVRLKNQKVNERKQNQLNTKLAKEATDVEKEEMNFDLFGQYVSAKMRNLSKISSEDEMETIEFNITSVVMKSRSKNVYSFNQAAGTYHHSVRHENKMSYLDKYKFIDFFLYG